MKTIRKSPSGILVEVAENALSFAGQVGTSTVIQPIGSGYTADTIAAERTVTVEPGQEGTLQYAVIGDVAEAGASIRKAINVAPVVDGVVGAEVNLQISAADEMRGYSVLIPGTWRVRCYMAISSGSAAAPVATVGSVNTNGALVLGSIIVRDT